MAPPETRIAKPENTVTPKTEEVLASPELAAMDDFIGHVEDLPEFNALLAETAPKVRPSFREFLVTPAEHIDWEEENIAESYSIGRINEFAHRTKKESAWIDPDGNRLDPAKVLPKIPGARKIAGNYLVEDTSGRLQYIDAETGKISTERPPKIRATYHAVNAEDEIYYQLEDGSWLDTDGKKVEFADILPKIAEAVFDPDIFGPSRNYRIRGADGVLRYFNQDGEEVAGALSKKEEEQA